MYLPRPKKKTLDRFSFLLGCLTGALAVVGVMTLFVWAQPCRIWVASTVASIHIDPVLLYFISLDLCVLNVVVLSPRVSSFFGKVKRQVVKRLVRVVIQISSASHPTPDLATDFDIPPAVVFKQLVRHSIGAVWAVLSIYRIRLLTQAVLSSPTAFAFVASSQNGTIIDDAVEEQQGIRDSVIQICGKVKRVARLTIWSSIVVAYIQFTAEVMVSVARCLEDVLRLVPRFCARLRASFRFACFDISRTIKDAAVLVPGVCVGSLWSDIARTTKGAVGLVLCFFVVRFGIYWPTIARTIKHIVGLVPRLAAWLFGALRSTLPCTYAIARAYIPARDRTFRGDRSVASDDADITLVEESLEEKGKNSTVVVPLTDSKVVSVETTLNPSVHAFVPTARPTAAIPTSQDAVRSIKEVAKDWEPVKPLSFLWARGGSAVRITAPPPPTSLAVSAPVSVPELKDALPAVDEDAGRAGLSASIWAPSPVVRQIKIVVDEDAGRVGVSASIWAPIPALPQAKVTTRAVDQDASRAGLSANMWAPARSAAPKAPVPAHVKRSHHRSARRPFWSPGGSTVRIVAP
ncbi:hypothetical protein B0H17DRAFT_1028389 [Mycena rosella]|uniref:Uncharacterized protein n=1 Tax=Mycena rosella TaxID=1033263 RepID=A0AAD7H194_MYCRO|nr:hypothetical protein B0H17DRAFT_1028389 [Mycena rosella]